MPARRRTARPAPSARPRRRTAVVAGLVGALVAGLTGGLGVAVAAPAGAVSPDVVLSQVYGGGGNTGAVLTNDFVELRNLGTAPVDLTGWSVQYASATGTTWAATPLAGSIAPGGYYLVQQAAGAGGTTALPTPDATGSTAMAAGSGKVALVTTSAALACGTACAGADGVRDLVGYGTATTFEGSGAAPALSSTTAALRTAGDTDDNRADFTAATPTPRSSGTAVPPPPTSTDCTASDTAVGAVQGSGAASPVVGSTVTVQGTVVGDYEGPAPALRGFYLQDAGDGDAATSDGLFVFNNLGGTSPDSVALGDVVQVTGRVSEFSDQTQVTASALALCSSGATVEPTDLTLPRTSATDLEPYEGMLVRLPQTLSVTEHFQLGRFGQVVVSSGGRLQQPTSVVAPGGAAKALQTQNDLNRLLVDDATNAQNPDPIVLARGGAPLSASNTLRGGDTVTGAVGVLTYTWAGNSASGNAFRLRPVGALGGSATFEPANPRPDGAPQVGGTVRVASANLLNFFNTFGRNACTLGVGGGPTDCRGAGDAVEYSRQLAKEVAAISSLDADVVGLMEVENDGYGPDSAIRALVDALNAGGGSWAFVDPDAASGTVNSAGTDAIKAALVYRSDRVTPVPGTTATDGAAGVFDRNPVAQTFALDTGAKVTVVVNHFKSKGSCPDAGTDPGNEDALDGQSCWNARRTAQATELARWLRADVVPATGVDDVLVIGDLNSYAKEDPVAALEAAGYVNLPARFEGRDAYTYAFDGQWGYLDHMLASPSLAAAATGVEDVHINADEPSVLDYSTDFKSPAQVASLYAPDRFRTSDHDPVVGGFRLLGATTTAVTSSAPQAVYGGEVRWTATVASSGTRAPTGTVRFTVAGQPFGDPVPLVDGRATSPATSALPPGATEVGATYSGDDGHSGSTVIFRQEVRFDVVVTRPAPGAAATAGSTVQVRVALRDAAGRPVAAALARGWVAQCRVTLAVSGVQSAAARCAKEYDASDRVVEASWKSDRTPKGSVTLTVAVTYPGIDAAQTVDRVLRLR